MSSNTGIPTFTSLSTSVQKRVALAMSKGRPGSLSVPSFRFKPTTEQVTEETVNPQDLEQVHRLEELGLDVYRVASSNSNPSSPSLTNKFTFTKRPKQTLSLDGDSPDGIDSSNRSLFSEIKDKIARTVEEKLNFFDNYSGSLLKKDRVEASVDEGAIEGIEAAQVAVEEPISDRPAVGEFDAIPEGDVDPIEYTGTKEATTEQTEIRRRKTLPGPIRFSALPNLDFDEREVVGDVREGERQSWKGGEETGDGTQTGQMSFSARGSGWSLNPFGFTKKTFFIVASLLFYQFLPFPPFVDGFVAGLSLAVLCAYFWHWLTRPSQPALESSSTPFVALPVNAFQTEGTIRKVWMNELLQTYVPESFHVNQTQSVMIRLDGSTLRVSYVKNRIPKRAMWNEPKFEPSVIHQRMYSLEGAKLKLLPEGLARKRYWSRRYPIEIKLTQGPCSRESGVPTNLVKDDPKTVLLFARSGREKEEWFRRLEAAATKGTDSQAEGLVSTEYDVFMRRLIPSPVKEAAGAPSETPSDPPSPFVEIRSESSTPSSVAEDAAWLNAVLGRCFWDFLHEQEWASRVRGKIQRKLATIRVPSFIEDLRLSDIELGTQLPQLGRVSAPTLDDRGLWVDAHVAYYGAFRMTLETKLNLMKLKKDSAADEARSDSPVDQVRPHLSSSIYDSEAEETGESSSDDEANSGETGESAADESATGRGSTGRKILKLVDSIAQSRYFQQATEYKYVKRAMEGVSVPLILTVELVSLSGTLVVNIPPPPSDRLWYGFRGNPSLSLVAKPKVGEREVQFAQIVEWIQNKLVLEFQRILVLPNMDDFILPIASPAPKTPLVQSKF